MSRIIDTGYRPRPLQAELHRQLKKHRFGVAVCHRRFGKTVCAINHLIDEALRSEKDRPRFGYVGPTYRQAKSIAWDYLKHYLDGIPGREFNESELRADFLGRRIQLFGADNPDSLRGIYLDGAVLDEYGLMQPKTFTEVLRPALSDRQGWALFIGTPNGKNQFWDISQTAKKEVGWFFAAYKASETGILPAEELADARRVMTPDEYAQEYECSFEASVKGAIYGAELAKARDDGRICKVPYEPLLQVETWWDLGVLDPTAIWFVQKDRTSYRAIDYYEATGEGLHHYAQVLKDKRYNYGAHHGPHDIEVRELGTGKSRKEMAAALGLYFQTGPNLPVDDGIHAVRMMLPKCYFDEEKCGAGIEALMNYRRDYNQRINEFKPTPVHDWASHGADAFRTGAIANRGGMKVDTITYPKVNRA